jgi:ABC-type sugar transport system ATPase subunit
VASVKLELKSVRKEFNGVLAVEDLSLEIVTGEFVSLLGPSGCGKSTTLAMIAGFEAPTAGTILFDGNRVDDLAPRFRRVGLVFQDYAIFTKMSVYENLAFGLEARGESRVETRRRVRETAELLEIVDVLAAPTNGLSMSELQRVALGRVLVLEPSLLLLDEPLSNLDATLRSRLRTELRGLQRRLGQTVLYVTHDHVEAMSMSDRIAVMNQGRLLQVDTVAEIYERPRERFVAEFLGEPPMNVVPATVEMEAGEAVAKVGPLRIPLDLKVKAGRWLLGVRPHHVRLSAAFGPSGAPVVVDLMEPTGPETVLHLNLNGQLIQALVPSTRSALPGETVWITIEPQHAHLIDADTGQIIR